MIEVKKARHTEINNDPIHRNCGLMVNIYISREEWQQLDTIMTDLNLNEVQTIEEALYAGLAMYNNRICWMVKK